MESNVQRKFIPMTAFKHKRKQNVQFQIIDLFQALLFNGFKNVCLTLHSELTNECISCKILHLPLIFLDLTRII